MELFPSLTLWDSFFPRSLSQNTFEVRCKVLQISWTVAFFCFARGSTISWREFRIIVNFGTLPLWFDWTNLCKIYYLSMLTKERVAESMNLYIYIWGCGASVPFPFTVLSFTPVLPNHIVYNGGGGLWWRQLSVNQSPNRKVKWSRVPQGPLPNSAPTHLLPVLSWDPDASSLTPMSWASPHHTLFQPSLASSCFSCATELLEKAFCSHCLSFFPTL